MPRRRQMSYSIDEKRRLLAAFAEREISSRTFCIENGIPRSTWRSWRQQRDALAATRINTKKPTLGGQGLACSIPFANELLSFMKDVRREEHILTSLHMITFMKKYHSDWLNDYTTGKRDGYKSLLKLCQDFAHRNRFSQRVPCFSKMPTEEMVTIRNDFAAKFWGKYHEYDLRDILNVDETAVHYEMPPGKIWAEIGKSSKVDKTQKHSDRLTAVLTCRANGTVCIIVSADVIIGEKLPILFIVHGKPGGTIDTQELATYPEGHFYDVQESAWMDGRVWDSYLEMLPPFVLGPSVVLADNFDSHVTEKSANAVAEDLHSILEPLPANCTSVCQPLDVGIMGPFKKLLRTLWLEEAPVVTAAEKRMAMIKRCIAAWDKITPQAVVRSFEKALPRPDIVLV